VLPVAGKSDQFIFIADRWRPKNAIDGRYVWLPIDIEGDHFTITWRSEWDLDHFHTSPDSVDFRLGTSGIAATALPVAH
jgi:hypothetical protein